MIERLVRMLEVWAERLVGVAEGWEDDLDRRFYAVLEGWHCPYDQEIDR